MMSMSWCHVVNMSWCQFQDFTMLWNWWYFQIPSVYIQTWLKVEMLSHLKKLTFKHVWIFINDIHFFEVFILHKRSSKVFNISLINFGIENKACIHKSRTGTEIKGDKWILLPTLAVNLKHPETFCVSKEFTHSSWIFDPQTTSYNITSTKF